MASDTIGKLQKEGSAHLQRLPLQPESRQFTYKELENLTNNFELEIGKGGFGTVYHGYLDDSTQVAVKMRSQSSSQGSKEFMAEVKYSLKMVHHDCFPILVLFMKTSQLRIVFGPPFWIRKGFEYDNNVTMMMAMPLVR